MFTKKAKSNVSIDDLKNKIHNFKNENSDEDSGGIYDFIWDEHTQSELKKYGIEFDCENFTGEGDQFDTPGFVAGYDICNGIPVRWIAAGGDWEKPIGFCIFINDKDELDVFVPHAGNVYDKDKNAAYGNYECKSVYEASDEKYNQIDMRNEFCEYIKLED